MSSNSLKKISFFVLFFMIGFFLFADNEAEEDISLNSNDETKIQLDANSQNKSTTEKQSETSAGKAESNFDVAVGEKAKSSSSGRILQLLIALIIVCVLAYIVIKFLKKSTNVFGVDDPYLKTVASMNIAQGKSVHVITLGDKAYIIGVTDSSINTIGEVEDKDLISAMNLEADKKSDLPKKDFTSVFAQFFPKIKQEEQNIGKDFFASQSERLNKANQNYEEGEK